MTHLKSQGEPRINLKMPEKRIFAKSGHVCMMCGFKATTKNKYRELQDHLVRRHFQDRIKAALPTRRPFMCPDHSCSVEGKDWQALMRHYTGKHGVLEAYIKEFLARQAEHKENLHLGRPVSPLPPTNKIGCRRRRYKRHSSGSNPGSESDPMAAEDRTEDPILPALIATSSSIVPQPPSLVESYGDHQEYVPQMSSPSTILQLDDSEPADLPPTHLALVLKRRRIGHDGLEEEPEETYAFVDLKYFQPLSANQYVMKSQVIEPSAMLNLSSPSSSNTSSPHCDHQKPQLEDNNANGGTYFLESSGESGQSPVATAAAAAPDHYFESFPPTTVTTTTLASPPPLTHIDFSTHTTASSSSQIYGIPSYDQVVPNPHPQVPAEAATVQFQDQQNIQVMEVGHLETVAKSSLSGRGCTKVVVETVKSIPMDDGNGVTATSEAAGYELISHEGIKEIDFTMF